MPTPPPPYCSPEMLIVLRNIQAKRNPGQDLPHKPGKVAGIMSQLMSRGWVSRGQTILTAAGEAYLVTQASPE